MAPGRCLKAGAFVFIRPCPAKSKFPVRQTKVEIVFLQLHRFLVLVTILSLCAPCYDSFADQPPSLENYQQLLANFSSPEKEACANAQTSWQNICFKLGRTEHEANRVKACEQMCASLATGQPLESALFILRLLERMGGNESVATLRQLVASNGQEVADGALRALQNIPSDSAYQALVDLLNSSPNEKFTINVINSLGYRMEAKSISTLATQLESPTSEVQLAAANALSRFDSLPAAKAIFSAWKKAPGAQADRLVETLIVSAKRVNKPGERTEAASMLRAVYDGSSKPNVRAAALSGLFSNVGQDSIQLMVKALNCDNVFEQQAAIGHVRELSKEEVVSLTESLPDMPAALQASLLTILGANRVEAALPAIEQACTNEHSLVKIAAITALGHLGSANHTQLLLDQLNGDDDLRAAASHSLAMIFDDEVDDLLLKRLAALKEGIQRAELISILSARRAPALADVMVDAKDLFSSDAEIRKRANGILNRLGTTKHIPALFTSMAKISATEQEGTAKTIVNICSRIPNADEKAAPVLNMYKNAPNELKPYLLSVAGRIGGKAAGNFISSKLASSSSHEKDAAITALCNWPDDSFCDQLLTIAQNGDTAAQRTRAIRAIARVVVLPSSKHSLQEQLNILKQTMKLATQDDERKLILDRVKAIGLSSTFEFVRSYLDSPSLSRQAEASLVHLARIRELRQADQSIRGDLERVSKNSLDVKLRDRAKQYLLEY